MTESSTSALPLAGLRVLDFTRVLAGPMCTMLLGDMGAEVIKIENPAGGDETRGWAPFVGGWSTYFLSVNRNKKSVALNLKSADGRALLDDLIRSSDVLVENFRPGTLDRLGFGYERARAMNERLIYCSISGYGTTGPRSGLPGYDMVIQGESGLMDVTGFPETGPTKVGVAITDCIAALYAVQAILLACISRSQTGRGQFLDIALLDSAVSVLGMPAGIVRATVDQGDRVRLVVTSDVADEIHLHGYDISRDVAAGGTVTLAFRASIPGRFEAELEERGVQIADITVEP